ncbi:hypothetical protein LCGC14_1353040 [marine sediment metagenome]|uniref:Uncharacterized protein n=1 Tax=marine sediment metagenome TaxID=412755 RepID=A0A0F9MQX6_9ZZZZ
MTNRFLLHKQLRDSVSVYRLVNFTVKTDACVHAAGRTAYAVHELYMALRTGLPGPTDSLGHFGQGPFRWMS